MVNWTKVYIPLLLEVDMKCMKAQTPIFSFLLPSCKYVGAFMNIKDRIIAANIWDLGSFSNVSIFQKSSIVFLWQGRGRIFYNIHITSMCWWCQWPCSPTPTSQICNYKREQKKSSVEFPPSRFHFISCKYYYNLTITNPKNIIIISIEHAKLKNFFCKIILKWPGPYFD